MRQQLGIVRASSSEEEDEEESDDESDASDAEGSGPGAAAVLRLLSGVVRAARALPAWCPWRRGRALGRCPQAQA
jgi:hypothetical protein